MKIHLISWFALAAAAVAHGQSLINSRHPGAPPRLLPADAAVLESSGPRRDLRCSVKPVLPELGFDFGFHSGYELSVPRREFVGNGNSLTAIFRVTPASEARQPAYFVQKWSVPSIEEKGAGGTVQLRGGFVLGEGSYEVEWLMRDHDERFCTARWKITVEQRRKDRLELRLPPGAVEAEPADPFANEATARPEGPRTLNVAVLLHIAPQTSGAAMLQPAETTAPLAILRSIARDPRIAGYSIAAFNLEQNKILYRQQQSPAIDFPALGDGVKQLHLGTVAVQKLIEKDSRAEFLSNLVAEETRMNEPDALIFIGPKTRDDRTVLTHFASELSALDCPIFYLNYDPHPITDPWRDLIGTAVKFWKGAEYRITTPRELSVSWTAVMSQLSAGKSAPHITTRTGLISGLAPQK